MKFVNSMVMVAVMAMVLMFGLSASAQIPNTISYQGIIATPGTPPTPLTGSHDLTFVIYDASTAGSTLWSETQTSVTLEDGRFSVILGSVISLSSLGFDIPYWLGISVDGGAEVGRFEFTSAAFAMTAKTVEDGAITRPKLAPDAVGSQEIANLAVTDQDLADGSVTAAKIAQSRATTGEVLKWNGSTWAPATATGPVAFGRILADGTVSWSSPSGVTCVYNAGNGYYEITIPGESYFIGSYIGIAQPMGNVAVTTGVSSVSGKMLVYMKDNSGAATQGSFTFLVFK